MRGLLVLLLFQCAGELIKIATGVTLPGAVIGLLLLFVFLVIRGGIPASVDAAGNVLIARLPLLLTAPCVGLFFLGERMRGHWLAVIVSVVLGTAITLFCSAIFMAKFTQWWGGSKS
ncbi:MAG: hypothetical protein JWM78_2715 [Verrucomicrobiaceae bacterium]|nr:hypothetical protein [Verrucomicrobiaceae bacterium]